MTSIFDRRTPAFPRRAGVLGMLVVLAGCATGADPGKMAPTTMQDVAIYPEPFRHGMCVRTVTGGETTNPLWVSKVDNDGFRSALSQSLESAGLGATERSCKFPVDVNLLGLSQPSFGISMEVISHVNYKVYGASGTPVLLETISAPFTATFSDSAIGFVRVKRANEGSIRENISGFLAKVRDIKAP